MAKKETINTVAGLVPNTKAPSGLSISRNGNTFTCKWKIADADYGDGQVFHYFVNNDRNYSKVATVKTTSKNVVLNMANFHPNRNGAYLTKFGFDIAGNRKAYKKKHGNVEVMVDPPMSSYTKKEFTILPPTAPSVSNSLSSSETNVCTFTWSAANNATASRWFRDVEWQSILIRDFNGDLPAETAWRANALGYQYGTGGATGSKTITENTAEITRGSCTRIFRARSRGVAGNSEWKYSKHVYALPYAAVISGAKVSATSSGGYLCTVRWTAANNKAHPIDATTVQYTFVTPEAGLQCPDGASWTDAAVLRDTDNTNEAATFSIGAQVGEDQCLFVRVCTEHDRKNRYGVTEGTPWMVTAGTLKAPTGLNVTINQDTMLATVAATDASSVPDSERMVRYYTVQNPNGTNLGVIPQGEASGTFQLPMSDKGKDITIGVYAVVRQNGVIKMQSAVNKAGGNIPVAPANVAVRMTDVVGTVQVTWDWSWQVATSAELSWSDHEDAWESTDAPSTYAIDNTHVGRWNISGLETGKTWYIRVRLATGTGDNLSYGAYSAIASIDLSSAPAIPVLTLSTGVVTEEGSFTASWSYSTGDGSGQAYAELAEVTNGQYTPIAHTQTAQHTTLNVEDLGWQSGEVHTLAVRVVSASGRQSDWSDGVYIAIADPITAAITSTSLEVITVTEDGATRTVNALTELPLTVTVEGAGGGGTTSVIIERAESYHVDRPDETKFRGHEGETIAYTTHMGQEPVSIGLEDLIGHLDDGARYRIIATVNDDLGQTAQASLDFEVVWEHQALMPTATAELLEDDVAMMITPTAPEGAEETDTCDIYRLSVDPPELIYEGAEFGETYVDPFPAIGEFGGHRVVFKTANGDYITEDNEFAWVDLREDEGDFLDSDYSIIDFADTRILISRNLDISNKWGKDFTQTQYLGGSVQGDWNPAIDRKASVATVAVSLLDQNMIQSMRRLAVYSGICHVRTSDGSSYSANIEVSDSYSHDTGRMVINYDLSITRVDPEGMDGVTLEEWQDAHPS